MREIQLQLNCIITTIVLLWCPISCVDNDFFYNKAPQRTKGKHITAGVTVYKLLIPVAVLLYVSLEKLTHCSGQMCTFFGGLGHMFALPRYGVNGTSRTQGVSESMLLCRCFCPGCSALPFKLYSHVDTTLNKSPLLLNLWLSQSPRQKRLLRSSSSY